MSLFHDSIFPSTQFVGNKRGSMQSKIEKIKWNLELTSNLKDLWWQLVSGFGERERVDFLRRVVVTLKLTEREST